jgi:hypothetical protein
MITIYLNIFECSIILFYLVYLLLQQPDGLASLVEECTEKPYPLKRYQDLVGKNV